MADIPIVYTCYNLNERRRFTYRCLAGFPAIDRSDVPRSYRRAAADLWILEFSVRSALSSAWAAS